jgi:hypothetical protein
MNRGMDEEEIERGIIGAGAEVVFPLDWISLFCRF